MSFFLGKEVGPFLARPLDDLLCRDRTATNAREAQE